MSNNFKIILEQLKGEKKVIEEAREDFGVVLPDGKTKLTFKERAVADQFRNVMKVYMKVNPSAGYGTLKKLAAMCKPLKGAKATEIVKAFEASTSMGEDVFEVSKVSAE